MLKMVLSSVGFSFIKDIVELYDSADEITKFYKIGSDNIDAALSWFLRADPLHHGGKSPEKGKKKRSCGFLRLKHGMKYMCISLGLRKYI